MDDIVERVKKMREAGHWVDYYLIEAVDEIKRLRELNGMAAATINLANGEIERLQKLLKEKAMTDNYIEGQTRTRPEDLCGIISQANNDLGFWNPIATAPKDQWILCYQPRNKGFTDGHCYVCKWAYNDQFWYDKVSDILFIKEGEDYTVRYLTCVPTHWMPLPEYPSDWTSGINQPANVKKEKE